MSRHFLGASPVNEEVGGEDGGGDRGCVGSVVGSDGSGSALDTTVEETYHPPLATLCPGKEEAAIIAAEETVEETVEETNYTNYLFMTTTSPNDEEAEMIAAEEMAVEMARETKRKKRRDEKQTPAGDQDEGPLEEVVEELIADGKASHRPGESDDPDNARTFHAWPFTTDQIRNESGSNMFSCGSGLGSKSIDRRGCVYICCIVGNWPPASPIGNVSTWMDRCDWVALPQSQDYGGDTAAEQWKVGGCCD